MCGKDIRSCAHCRFYRPESSVYCREPQAAAELPRDRERANFCDWFSLDPKFRSAGPGQKKEKDLAARTAFDNLFNPHG
jgi:hypothetical protein